MRTGFPEEIPGIPDELGIVTEGSAIRMGSRRFGVAWRRGIPGTGGIGSRPFRARSRWGRVGPGASARSQAQADALGCPMAPRWGVERYDGGGPLAMAEGDPRARTDPTPASCPS